MAFFSPVKKREVSPYYPIASLWANSIELRSLYFKQHSARVAKFAEILGKASKFPDLEMLTFAALLHDVGMVVVPEEILYKPESLTESEWEIVRKHSEVGEALISTIPELKEVATWVGDHHEAVNGRGYPRGKMGEEISRAGKILAIADAYDALTSDRPYRIAFTPAQAKEILIQNAGIHWDTHLVQLAIEHFPPRISETEIEVPYLEIFDSLLRSRYDDLRKTTLLVKIGESFRQLAHPPAYPRKILEIICTAFPAFGGYLFATLRGNRFVVRATEGFTLPEDFENFDRQDPFFQTFMAGGALSFFSVDEKNPFHFILKKHGYKGFVFLPLSFFERWLGFILLFLRPDQQLRSEDVQFFETFSQFVSSSLDSVLSIEEAGESWITDPLTGTYSWRTFTLKFHEEVARAKRSNEKFSIVLIIYPEYFRLRTQFNEQVAETALVELAKTLQHNLRASDIVARYEENSFVLLLPNTPSLNAKIAIKRLQGAFLAKAIYSIERASSYLTFQHGISSFPEDGFSLKELMMKARLRLQA
ncbi:MAG: HD domain-containing phosphohydrolase [bacterium JZ-2024 1]